LSSGGPTFDVTAWVATIARCTRDDVEFGGQNETGGYLSTIYLRAGEPLATVDLVALPMAGGRRGAWQLFASVDGRLTRVQMPSSTRFSWR
jgi:hypothetical protein